MKLRRGDIFNYITYIQSHLGSRDKRMTPEAYRQLQKVYESFVNSLPKDKAYSLTDQEVKKLEYSIIAIVAQDADDQAELTNCFKRWNNFYKGKYNPIFAHAGLDNEQVEVVKKKLTSYTIPILLLSLFVLYQIFSTVTIHRTAKTDTESIVIEKTGIIPIPLDLEQYIEFDSIQYPPVYIPATEELRIGDKFKLNIPNLSEFNKEPIDQSLSSFPPKDTTWLGKLHSLDARIELDNGLFIYENDNFGAFTFEPNDKKGASTISFWVKSKRNWMGMEWKQKIELTIITKESVVDTIPAGFFPVVSIQKYPHPKRTLQVLEDTPDIKKSFLGKYKLPISLLISVLTWFIIYLVQKPKENKEAAQKDEHKYNHPYFWKITLPSVPEVNLSETVDRKVHLLRSKMLSGRIALNVPQTIKKTVDSGGFVTFQFNEESIKSEFLFLIGHRSQSDHNASLWNEIVSGLNAKDINTTIFHYNSDVRLCYNDQFPNGLSLKELHNYYSSSILVVIGDYYNFMSPITGKLNQWTTIFENWSTRYLLSSKNYFTWDRREETVGRLFHVLPLKVSSLAYFQILPNDTEKLKYKPNRSEHLNNFGSEITLKDVKISFTKPQKDWIAACCLFPSLHYDLSLSIGKIVFAHHNKDFSTKEIEEVFSLPWFLLGSIPAEIRKSLIDDLESKNQKLTDCVRSFIVDEVQLSYPPVGSHASDWFREGVLINELLNKSNRPNEQKKEEIEKELNEIYSRGLQADIQVEKKANLIKNPPLSTRLKRWFTDSQNKFKLFIASCLFIVPYILLTLFFNEQQCNESYETIETIPLNYDLIENNLSLNEPFDLQKSSEETICKSTLPDADKIFEENQLRRDIFMGVDEIVERHPALIESDQLQEVVELNYNEAFKKNIAADLLNKALIDARSLRNEPNQAIFSSSEKSKIAVDFCKKVTSSNNLVESGSSANTYEFEDTLAIMVNWCEEFTKSLENSISFIGFDKTTDEYKEMVDELENKFDYFVLEGATPFGESVQSPTIFYFEESDEKEADRLRKRISKTFRKKPSPQLAKKQKGAVGRFIVVLPGASTAVNVGTTCAECESRLSEKDTEPPQFEQPNNPNLWVKEVFSSNGNCSSMVSWETPTVSDNCGVKSITSDRSSGDQFYEGKSKVTFTATDFCGNTSTQTLVVISRCAQGLDLNGTVLDYDTKKPIYNATIQQGNNRTRTNRIGKYSLKDFNKNSPITFLKTGYIKEEVSIIPDNQILNVSLRKESISTPISGIVLDDKGRPLIDANVFVPKTNVNTTTDFDGAFALNVPEGSNEIIITYKGYEKEVVNLDKTGRNIKIQLRPIDDFQMKVQVLDKKTGRPVPSTSIRIKRNNGTDIKSTDQAGSLNISNFNNVIEILVSKRNYEEQTLSYNALIKNSVVYLSLKSTRSQGLPPNLSIRGSINDGTEALIGANVLIKGTSSGTITDIDGTFSLRVPSKDFTLVVSYSGYKPQEKTIDVSSYFNAEGKQTKEIKFSMKER
ncbi:MAG: carboxypeptidase-like regulatory domain-containing protein [Saprospiraceae bacterium]|nr:carboxypeptidase-like regulatory domain-containing protein [Saprospiraceae bacterium]